VLPLILAATSKVPFYIAGGVFAAWAVVLATLGLRNPTFPGGAGGQRAVMAISLVLAVVAMGMAIATATRG
jgi:hypothetical protein